MKNYIGLDAHSKTCTFVNVDIEGNIKNSGKVETSESSIKAFLKSIKGEKILTFEESALSQWLFVTLRKEVEELIVCNPLYLSRNPRTKNDYNDANSLLLK